DVLVRLEDGLAEPSGQRRFDFEQEPERPAVDFAPSAPGPDQLFEEACNHEEAGRFEEAISVYRQMLLAGGATPQVCLNLANALYNIGQKEAAAERLYQAVELDGGFAEAWNNLGVVLTKLGRRREAAAAFGQALTARPYYSDAHY